jgi:mRNA-degrading endonuclease RelE of RelBE toxin-antitoxin system
MSDSDKPKYEVVSTDHAASLIKALDGSVKQALKKALGKKLAVDPEGYGTNLRASLVGYTKHEFFNHRIVYRIYSDLSLVVVCFVGIRKKGDTTDVYNQLAPLVEAGRLAQQISAVLNTTSKSVFQTKGAKKTFKKRSSRPQKK